MARALRNKVSGEVYQKKRSHGIFLKFSLIIINLVSTFQDLLQKKASNCLLNLWRWEKDGCWIDEAKVWFWFAEQIPLLLRWGLADRRENFQSYALCVWIFPTLISEVRLKIHYDKTDSLTLSGLLQRNWYKWAIRDGTLSFNVRFLCSSYT